MNTEIALDFLGYESLSFVLRKLGFDRNFIKWIENLLKDQFSCVINDGTTVQYFDLERDAR